MREIALVIGAVNVTLKHLGELPDASEARALRGGPAPSPEPEPSSTTRIKVR